VPGGGGGRGRVTDGARGPSDKLVVAQLVSTPSFMQSVLLIFFRLSLRMPVYRVPLNSYLFYAVIHCIAECFK
jgi:hypothetical protein